MNEESREEWVERVLASNEGIRRATPPAFLYTRIASHLQSQTVRPFAVSLAAASFLMLVAFNTFVLMQTPEQKPNRPGNAASQSDQLNHERFELY